MLMFNRRNSLPLNKSKGAPGGALRARAVSAVARHWGLLGLPHSLVHAATARGGKRTAPVWAYRAVGGSTLANAHSGSAGRCRRGGVTAGARGACRVPRERPSQLPGTRSSSAPMPRERASTATRRRLDWPARAGRTKRRTQLRARSAASGAKAARSRANSPQWCRTASKLSTLCTRLGTIGVRPNIVVTIAALGDPCLQS